MRIVGFKYKKSIKVIESLIFKDDKGFINDNETDTEGVYIADKSEYVIMEDLLNLINEPEELIYLETKLNLNLSDIIAKKIYVNEFGHLSNMHGTEVIDLDNLKFIKINLDLFNKIKSNPTRINLKNIDFNKTYGTADIELFESYDKQEINEINLEELVKLSLDAVAETKLENMKLKESIANLNKKIELLEGGI